MINKKLIKDSVSIINLVDLEQSNLKQVSCIVNAILTNQVAIMVHLNELEILIKQKDEK